MTECRFDTTLLSVLLDKELAPNEERAAKEHLATCGMCSAHYQELLAVHALLVAIPKLPLPAELQRRLMGNVPHLSFSTCITGLSVIVTTALRGFVVREDRIPQLYSDGTIPNWFLRYILFI
jgi:hypothetical protein